MNIHSGKAHLERYELERKEVAMFSRLTMRDVCEMPESL
jgi:hypothetical protein